MTTAEAQINLRLPADLDCWLEARAGGTRAKSAYVRALLERERARDEEGELLRTFNTAWDSLSEEERAELREERDGLMNGYSGGGAR